MRVMDAILAFPALLLAMAVTLGLGVGIRTATIGIIIPTIPWYARLIRSDVLRIRALPFVEASVTLGARRSRTVTRHIFPHTIPTIGDSGWGGLQLRDPHARGARLRRPGAPGSDPGVGDDESPTVSTTLSLASGGSLSFPVWGS